LPGLVNITLPITLHGQLTNVISSIGENRVKKDDS